MGNMIEMIPFHAGGEKRVIQIAVVDDRQADVEQIQALLRVYIQKNGLEIQISVFNSGESFLEQLRPGQFDLIFMDIVMQGIDGLETARRLRAMDAKVLLVFVTTESDYAIEGYEVEAAGFLVKAPQLDQNRFDRVMNHVCKKLYDCVMVDLTDTPIRLKLPADSIYYAEISDHKLTIRTDSTSYQLRMTIGQFKTRLPKDNRFFECYKGIVINLDAVDILNRQNVVMKDGATLPVSRRQCEKLADAYAARSFTWLRKSHPLK